MDLIFVSVDLAFFISLFLEVFFLLIVISMISSSTSSQYSLKSLTNQLQLGTLNYDIRTINIIVKTFTEFVRDPLKLTS